MSSYDNPEVDPGTACVEARELRTALREDPRIRAQIVGPDGRFIIGLNQGRGLSEVLLAQVGEHTLRQQLRATVTFAGGEVYGLVKAEIDGYPTAYFTAMASDGRKATLHPKGVLRGDRLAIMDSMTPVGMASTYTALSTDGTQVAMLHRGPGFVELLGTEYPDFEAGHDRIAPELWMVPAIEIARSFVRAHDMVH